jgi:hypothetical protein
MFITSRRGPWVSASAWHSRAAPPRHDRQDWLAVQGNCHDGRTPEQASIEEHLMNHELFSILARRASPRRLDVAEATAEAKPVTANAKKNHRKKGDVNKLCKQQAEEWAAFFPTVCPDGDACADLLTCTSSALARCDFTAFLVCANASTEGLAEGISLR